MAGNGAAPPSEVPTLLWTADGTHPPLRSRQLRPTKQTPVHTPAAHGPYNPPESPAPQRRGKAVRRERTPRVPFMQNSMELPTSPRSLFEPPSLFDPAQGSAVAHIQARHLRRPPPPHTPAPRGNPSADDEHASGSRGRVCTGRHGRHGAEHGVEGSHHHHHHHTPSVACERPRRRRRQWRSGTRARRPCVQQAARTSAAAKAAGDPARGGSVAGGSLDASRATAPRRPEATHPSHAARRRRLSYSRPLAPAGRLHPVAPASVPLPRHRRARRRRAPGGHRTIDLQAIPGGACCASPCGPSHRSVRQRVAQCHPDGLARRRAARGRGLGAKLPSLPSHSLRYLQTRQRAEEARRRRGSSSCPGTGSTGTGLAMAALAAAAAATASSGGYVAAGSATREEPPPPSSGRRACARPSTRSSSPTPSTPAPPAPPCPGLPASSRPAHRPSGRRDRARGLGARATGAARGSRRRRVPRRA